MNFILFFSKKQKKTLTKKTIYEFLFKFIKKKK